jgi:hypothetical protein
MHRTSAIFASFFALVLAGGSVAAADLKDMKVLEDDVGTRAVLSIQGATNCLPCRTPIDWSST